MQDRDWNRLIRQLRSGECIPFIGAGACAGTLPGGSKLAETFADDYDYPFEDRNDLARVMQYAAHEVGDPVDLKGMVAQHLAAYAAPDFTAVASPHRLLAGFPIPLYITTNYDPFMSLALSASGRSPQTMLCSWYRSSADQSYTPTVAAPVVFHLHGALHDPASMILTQDDYLSFILALAIDKGFDEKLLIPTQLLPLLTLRPLLFIGYSLKDWSFQVLSQGLSRLLVREEKRRHISIQLVDSLKDGDPATESRARDFLNRQLDQQRITVFWGSAADFCTELSSRMGGAGVK